MAKPTSMLEQHPIALQYAPGQMTDEEFAALKADIKTRGQQHPITTYQGKILDGNHRYRVCTEEGIEPLIRDYTGKDPEGMVIAMNLLRRKLGATQRATAGANLNLHHGISQDEASKRVGVSKLHISIAAQILKSNNARMIKMLEKPDVTREQLYEEAVDAGIMSGATRRNVVENIAPTSDLDAFFRGAPISGAPDDNDTEDLIGDGLDDVLGTPPTAGGKVLTGKPDSTVGTRPKHPERRAVETPASKLASAFKGMTQSDQIDFVKFSWPLLSKAVLAAGVAMPADPAAAAVATTKAISKAKASAAATAPAKPAPKGKAKAAAK